MTFRQAPDGRRERAKQGGFAIDREASKALTDALTRLDRNTYVDRTELLVGDYLDQWLESRVSLRPATLVLYQSAVSVYLKPQLGRHHLVELRPVDVERAFARIRSGLDGRAKLASPALLFRLKVTLRTALNHAVRRGLLFTNPAVFVDVEPHTRPP